MREGFFKQTIATYKGAYQLPPVLANTLQWIRDSYQVNPINVAFETLGNLYSQSISIVFETKEDRDKMWAHCDAIASQFFNEIFKKENQEAIAGHGRILGLRQKKLPGATFTFESLEQLSLRSAVLQLGKGHEALIADYPDLLWNIRYAENRFIIFYFTEEQVMKSNENGITNKIIANFIQMLKKFDELNLITHDLLINSHALVVDSKENYDKNFGGEDWMYFR
jgi:hypothetical protein